MPKTLQGANRGAFKGRATIPSPGEPRNTKNSIEDPFLALLDDLAFLNAEVLAFLDAIDNHTHPLATSTVAGFMSPGEKDKLAGLSNQLQAHAHALATTEAPGFMSKEQFAKLRDIETGAQKVTRARVDTALQTQYGSVVIPESSYSAGQVKQYSIVMPGVKVDDCTALSDSISGGGLFLVGHRTRAGEVEIYVRNLASTSRTFEGGEVRAVVQDWIPQP